MDIVGGSDGSPGRLIPGPQNADERVGTSMLSALIVRPSESINRHW